MARRLAMGRGIKGSWAYLATASSIIFALLLLIVDPLIAHTPWFAYPDPDLWVVLGFPLLPWVAVAGTMIWLCRAATRWLHAVMLSLISLAAGVVPSLLWPLLLADAYPDAGNSTLALTTSLCAGAALLVLGLLIAVRAVFARLKNPRSSATGN